MPQILSNPIFYVLVANIIGLIWAIRSWKKNIQEKWMNNLRDAASEMIGAAEEIYLNTLMSADKKENFFDVSVASRFITKEQKVLLLFTENSETQTEFKNYAENLRRAAEQGGIENYQAEKQKFSSLVAQRLLTEWEDIKSIW